VAAELPRRLRELLAQLRPDNFTWLAEVLVAQVSPPTTP
jgi:hypothetical protein